MLQILLWRISWRNKSRSPIHSEICPFSFDSSFCFCLQHLWRSVTSGEITLHRGTVRRQVDCTFRSATWFSRLGNRTLKHKARSRPFDNTPNKIGDPQAFFLYSFSCLIPFWFLSVHASFLTSNPWKSRILSVIGKKYELKDTKLINLKS